MPARAMAAPSAEAVHGPMVVVVIAVMVVMVTIMVLAVHRHAAMEKAVAKAAMETANAVSSSVDLREDHAEQRNGHDANGFA
jgi:sensor histidine kinase regulating citrate/malate metabolism